MKLGRIVGMLAGVLAASAWLSAAAQQVTGVPGSPSYAWRAR